MSGRRSMSGADAAWYRMDSPTNRMVITTVLRLVAPLDLEALRALVAERIVDRFAPFAQIVTSARPLGALQWQDAPDFDLELHVHRRALGGDGDDAALQELVADLMATGLDPSRPLWDMYLVEGYGNGSALIMRIHHCVADGIALARVMLTLTDESPDDPFDAPRRGAPQHRASRINALFAPARAVIGVAGLLAHESVEALVHPRRLLDAAEEVRADAAALLDLLGAPDEHESALNAPIGAAQRVAWTAPLPLGVIKSIAHETATTVNDVLLTVLAGGLGRYLDEDVEEIHVLIPVNLRPDDGPLPAELGNHFGLVLLAVPLGIADPADRLVEVHRRMLAIKASHQPIVSYAALELMGRAPAQLEDRLLSLMSDKGVAVVTNVPGPREPVYLAGVEVEDVLVWAPCAGRIGTSVSLFSYRDAVTIGFATHAAQVPDPARIADEVLLDLLALDTTGAT